MVNRAVRIPLPKVIEAMFRHHCAYNSVGEPAGEPSGRLP
jgi:hypothetical protein